MATSVYKTILDSDKASTRTLLHEYIPITGTLVSGAYGGNTVVLGSEPHIQAFAHGMFQSVYDYPYLSSSANHIMDVSVGISPQSALSGSPAQAQCKGRGGASTHADCNVFMQDKKLNMYAQMAQVLQGYDKTNEIARFDEDGDLSGTGGTKLDNCIFVSLTRLLTKDEIKKGSFSMDLNVTTDPTSQLKTVRINDTGAATNFFNASSGEYGILYASPLAGAAVHGDAAQTKVGLIYYQAGVMVLSSSVLQPSTSGHPGLVKASAANPEFGEVNLTVAKSGPGIPSTAKFRDLLTGSNFNDAANMFRSRILKMSFNNTTELNSMVYFCRAKHNEFNYSGNRTYLEGSKIRVKNQAQDHPRSYITTVGLYSANNELMAVAKLSEPIRKDPTNEVTLRVRLDY